MTPETYMKDINARFWIGVWMLLIGMVIFFALLPFLPNEDSDKAPVRDTIRDTIYVNDDTTKTVMEKYCDPEHYETFTMNGRLMVKRKTKGVRDDR